MVRYYGAYANRARKLYRLEDGEVGVQVVDPEPAPAGQTSWARLLRQVFEVDVGRELFVRGAPSCAVLPVLVRARLVGVGFACFATVLAARIWWLAVPSLGGGF